MRRLVALALLAVVVVGCGPKVVGYGNADKLAGAYEVCRWENIGYAFVPVPFVGEAIGGALKNKCMRELGWEPVPGELMGYRWVGR